MMEYDLRFSFEDTNNEAEYEEMIAALMWFKSLGVQQVLVRGDSKLVMDQIKFEYEVKIETLIKYHEKAVTMTKGFNQTIFQHVPRGQNEEGDRCDACQKLSTISQKPTASLIPVVIPIPFAMWGIDLVGKSQKAKGGVEYAVVIVDYFSNEPHSFQRIEEEFGANGREQGGMARRVVKWVGETPFTIVYGTEAMLPVEVGLPSYRQKGFDEGENNQGMKRELNFTDELRDQALFKRFQYKHLMARSYNRRVKNREFKVTKVVGPATYELSHVNGKPISHTWHATKLCKYYI
ncbi:hypothetical protein LIER_05778 [Lithospermum erythrorhizon]|uniref:RNase H type-1 domain-containing protein n=1 Tax=Lithospermum erythrorhizon TaxID=34254 RepID=A0AAV3P5W2_LITER